MKVYVVYDIETTGLDSSTSQITQIAAARVAYDGEKLVVLRRYNRYLKIRGQVPPTITQLTGITNELLNKEGVRPGIAMREFEEFSEGAIMVAHNGKRFDSKFIRREMQAAGISYRHEEIDTLLLAKKLWRMPSNSLGALVERFGLDKAEAHRADGDVAMLVNLFEFMLRYIDRSYKKWEGQSVLLECSFTNK